MPSICAFWASVAPTWVSMRLHVLEVVFGAAAVVTAAVVRESQRAANDRHQRSCDCRHREAAAFWIDESHASTPSVCDGSMLAAPRFALFARV